MGIPDTLGMFHEIMKVEGGKELVLDMEERAGCEWEGVQSRLILSPCWALITLREE